MGHLNGLRYSPTYIEKYKINRRISVWNQSNRLSMVQISAGPEK
jgi:hypothetical protein